MCLAVPARVIERNGDTAIADLAGNRVQVSLVLVPEAAAGDWVLLHAGFAIQKLDEHEVKFIGSALASQGKSRPGDASD